MTDDKKFKASHELICQMAATVASGISESVLMDAVKKKIDPTEAIKTVANGSILLAKEICAIVEKESGE